MYSYVFFLIENSASISIEKPKTINKKAVIAPPQLHFPSTSKRRKTEVSESSEEEHENAAEVGELKKKTVAEISEEGHEDVERNHQSRQEEKLPHDKNSESDEDDSECSQDNSAESDDGKTEDINNNKENFMNQKDSVLSLKDLMVVRVDTPLQSSSNKKYFSINFGRFTNVSYFGSY